MNLTKLNRRIVRETDVLINGVPVIISLEPGGNIGIRTKRSVVQQRRKRMRLLLSPSTQQQIVGGLMSLVSLMEVVL